MSPVDRPRCCKAASARTEQHKSMRRRTITAGAPPLRRRRVTRHYSATQRRIAISHRNMTATGANGKISCSADRPSTTNFDSEGESTVNSKPIFLRAGVLACMLTAGAPALAQSNIDKMRGFQATGTSLDIPTVPQDAAMAAQIRKNLEQVKLPPGFKIDLFAIVPDARHMAVSKSIGVVYTGTRKSQAWAVTDRDRDRIADEVKVLAPSIAMKVPNGMCMTNDGVLYWSSTTAFSSCRPSSSSTRARTSQSTASSSRWSPSKRSRSTTARAPVPSARTTSSTSPLASRSTFRPRKSASCTRSGGSAASCA